jgi:hypothetical protein
MFAGLDAWRKSPQMLRKAMWTGLYAGLGAASTMITRRLATKIWRIATGEEPPTGR